MRERWAALAAALPPWPYVAVALAFLASRVVYLAVFGVRFDTSPVGFYIQYLNPWFLERDLARSLFYLHHQAPLQNLLVGLPLRALGPDAAYALLQALYVALGLGTALGMLHAMLRLGAVPAVAAVLCALYAVSPVTVLYENWLMYHQPVTCLLVLSLLALLRFLRQGTPRAAGLFFALLAAVALWRSIFGPLFLAAVAALLMLRPPPATGAGRGARMVVLRAAAVPLLLTALNAAKPRLLLGYDYGEALLWGNLATKVYDELAPAERDLLVRSGDLPPAMDVYFMGDLANFGPLRIPHPPTGIPLLDLERSPETGGWNAHALEYLLMARQYYKPATLYLLSHHPGAYARSVWHALSRRYTGSPTTDDMLPGTTNYKRLRRLDEAIKDACGRGPHERLLALAISLPLAAAYGAYRLARRRGDGSPVPATAIAYMLCTIGYVTAVTVLVSSGDFSRYRFDIDPFYLVLAALLVSDLARWSAVRIRAGKR